MHCRMVCSLILVLGLAVHAQSINVHGKITNKAGAAVPSAIVTLVGQALKDTTAADGSYELIKTGVAVMPLLVPKTEMITMNKGILEFRVANPSPVKVAIFDINGNLVKKELLQNAVAGVYRLNFTEHNRVSNLLVIHASIGKHVTTFRYVPIQNSNYALNRSVAKEAPTMGKLAKIAAISDTVKVAANGYLASATVLTSYDTTLNIVLSPDTALTLRLDQTRQVIDGFGINNNWKELGDNGISGCFDSVNGLGLTILRIGMNKDGNVMSGAADISKARSRGAKIIGSTWSPPAGDKTNNNENDGGHLKTTSYDSWATKIANFAKANNLYSMSLGNEPDFASCGPVEPCNGNYPTTLYTAEEMVAFIKVLGPKMRSAAPNCKIMAPEASEWIHTWSDTSGCCSVPGNKPSSDPLKCGCFTGKTTPCGCAPGKGYSYGKYLYEDKAAWAFVDIVGVHQYDTQKSVPWPDYIAVADRRPVWQTEMSGVKWWPDGTPSTTIENGIAVAEWIHDALTVGELNAWCFWWYNGGSDTNEGLYLNGTDTKRHYTFGNYSKYVRPGMTRVEIAGKSPDGVLLTAFKGNDGKVVIVAINKGSTSATIPITIAGGSAPASFIPYVTSGSANENWSAKTPVSASGSILTVTLGSKTVTTFVGK